MINGTVSFTYRSFRQEDVQTERLGIKRHYEDDPRKNNSVTSPKRKQNKTRAAKSKAQLRYTEAHKEPVKRSIRSDKKNFVEQLATEAENATSKGDLSELYKITKTLSGETTTGNDANKG